ncbi:MAG: hypothetical protein MI799_07450 [Desulfobacterales bacterium]|nr:hypothetical protein [Desulfobacterales bacterium]
MIFVLSVTGLVSEPGSKPIIAEAKIAKHHPSQISGSRYPQKASLR